MCLCLYTKIDIYIYKIVTSPLPHYLNIILGAINIYRKHNKTSSLFNFFCFLTLRNTFLPPLAHFLYIHSYIYIYIHTVSNKDEQLNGNPTRPKQQLLDEQKTRKKASVARIPPFCSSQFIRTLSHSVYLSIFL